jgi:hypothetical protein
VSRETLGTELRRRVEPKPQSAGTQVFPLPPRACERNVGAHVETPVGADRGGVSVLTTVGVGAAPAAPPSLPSLPSLSRPAPRTLARAADEPTCIFVLAPGLSAEDGVAPASGAPSRRTATFASPPFAPVPNVVAPPRGAGVIARPPASGASRALPKAKPRADASPAATAPGAPLLRAFDDARARMTTWATAQTLSAPVAELARAVADADRAPARAQTAIDAAKGSRPPRASLGLLARLRSLPTARKLSLVVLAMTVVVSGGSLLGRSVAQTAQATAGKTAVAQTTARETSAAQTSAAQTAAPKKTAPQTTAAPTRPSAADRAPAVPAAGLASAAPVDAAPSESEVAAAAAPVGAAPSEGEVSAAAVPSSAERGSPPNPSSAPGSATRARRAVDALLAGDRVAALQLYRELSREEPGRRVYHEAVRLLAQPAPAAP